METSRIIRENAALALIASIKVHVNAKPQKRRSESPQHLSEAKRWGSQGRKEPSIINLISHQRKTKYLEESQLSHNQNRGFICKRKRKHKKKEHRRPVAYRRIEIGTRETDGPG
ncbi:hypothetical protein GOBAR_AA18525 [Gossypium barbadense]|uniref:Uncharacterized protein n=1 Tax=Gossypium barbadense TaxID=3634 RepID=A0A2P5XFL8_GOSBA|nr:hypothetical protein GOBAR_AA18525 [Gossypium barbadense]